MLTAYLNNLTDTVFMETDSADIIVLNAYIKVGYNKKLIVNSTNVS